MPRHFSTTRPAAALMTALIVLAAHPTLARGQEQESQTEAKTDTAQEAHAAAHAHAVSDDITVTDPSTALQRERQLIRGVRQLTFEGRRAGEGYFNADGTRMVFQSEREPGNPFFQIYLLDLTTGETTRVSPGTGKTTCAWIHPDGDRVMFASTHDDPDALAEQKELIEQRESGNEPRYSWDYDRYFDIYEFDVESGKYTNLTRTNGYDAEGSYSPDGSLIAFASNRAAYEQELSKEDQQKFDTDPAWAMDLYLMNADGSNVRRLTDVPGYDGGPFFSPNGEKLCWRRFSENGATAEIMTMNLDGSDEKQLTQLEAMSWAPYFHPTGDYLIFTTNKHGFANFELYMIDADAKHEPVRVTYTAGFDGLPVFTPDGESLAWTTNRTPGGQSQIHVADWDDRKARELLGLAAPESSVASSDSSANPRGRAPGERDEFAPADLVRHVEYLCRPQLGGRLTGTKGEKLATNYVALHLETLGLEPAGEDGTFFQEFDFTAGVSLGENNILDDSGAAQLRPGRDWTPVSFSRTGPIEPAGVVFAGYGITAPASADADNPQEEYDSFVHLDVKDKWIMTFRFLPEDITSDRRQHLARFASLRRKAMQARDAGAAGLIVVSGPTSKARQQLIPLRFDGSMGGTDLPIISVTDNVAARWLKLADKDLEQLQQKLDSGDMAMGFEIPGLTLKGAIEIEQEKLTGRNVLARLVVGDAPSSEFVIVGAHVDHLGTGANSGSLAREEEQSGIHFGADDNASGVAAVLTMAEALAARRDAGTLKGHRDIVFAAWSGEELGLLGSAHYVKQFAAMHSHAAHAHGAHGDPHAIPHGAVADQGVAEVTAEDTPRIVPGTPKIRALSDEEIAATQAAAAQVEKPSEAHHVAVSSGVYPAIAACLNLDMVGRFDQKLILQGVGSSGIWEQLIERANVPVGLPIGLQRDSYLPTDASSFFMQGVPILSAFTGSHSDYHTPRDTPEKLDYQSAARIAQLMAGIAVQLSALESPPEYVAQMAPEEGQRRANLRAYLGSVPDYADTDTKGVLLSGVAKGGPSDKAGVQSGDVIVGLAGRKIENIYDYTYAIEALKIGEEVEIIVRRDGKDITLKVTPGSRQ